MITNIDVSTNAAAQPEAAHGIRIGPPTVAANNGADLHNKSLKAFIASDVSMAEWTRLPAPLARDKLTGLSRTSLNEAIERGDVKAITVRQPGAVRGIKLVNVASLRAWLARLDAAQNGQQPVHQNGGGE